MLLGGRVVSIVVLSLFSLTMATVKENSAELEVLQNHSQLTFNIYKILEENEGNIFFSPLSIHAVLSMVFQGTLGSTSQQLASVLKIPEAETTAKGYNEIMNRLSTVENIILHMANKIYLMRGCEFLIDFETTVRKNFLADVELINFKNNEESAKTINTWVEEKTQKKIKNLVEPDHLNEFTRLVLINAIYFKGDWKYKFDKAQTTTEPFYINESDKQDVQMMHIKNKFSYKWDEKLDVQILEMPYINENFSMVFVLPKEKNGIIDLEKKLAPADLMDITRDMRTIDVNVALPKFKIEQTIDLKNVLIKLGLDEMFNEDKANLKGMIKLKLDENLYVSKAVQKAFIEVNEEGAEAAAASSVIVRMKRSMPITKTFYADHPFIFFIVDKSNQALNTILFTGKVEKVTESGRETKHDEL